MDELARGVPLAGRQERRSPVRDIEIRCQSVAHTLKVGLWSEVTLPGQIKNRERFAPLLGHGRRSRGDRASPCQIP